MLHILITEAGDCIPLGCASPCIFAVQSWLHYMKLGFSSFFLEECMDKKKIVEPLQLVPLEPSLRASFVKKKNKGLGPLVVQHPSFLSHAQPFIERLHHPGGLQACGGTLLFGASFTQCDQCV